MQIYMDCCCLNRLFDNQSNPIVHLEAEAIKIVMSLCDRGIFTLVSSQILKFEIENTPDVLRRESVLHPRSTGQTGHNSFKTVMFGH